MARFSAVFVTVLLALLLEHRLFHGGRGGPLAFVHAEAPANQSVLDAMQAAPQLSAMSQKVAMLQPAMGYINFLHETAFHSGGITIFAPNNAAFQALGPYNTCLSSYARAGAMTSSVLNNHILFGSFPASTLQDKQSVRTLSNTNLVITRNTSGVFVNEARVVRPDLIIRNDGVVHVIDRVLLPVGLEYPLFQVCSQTGSGLAG